MAEEVARIIKNHDELKKLYQGLVGNKGKVGLRVHGGLQGAVNPFVPKAYPVYVRAEFVPDIPAWYIDIRPWLKRDNPNLKGKKHV